MSIAFGKFKLADSLLPGKPFDYINTPILSPDNQELIAQRQVLIDLMDDTIALPTTEAREGYFGERHAEYWLSGYRDAGRAIAATNLTAKEKPRILDFGGASGRVARHFPRLFPDSELFLCDINFKHITLTRNMFHQRITAVRNYSVPYLPFPDQFFDLIVCFSVFTHLDADDIGWLLELRRITRSGGYIYATVHDEATWAKIPETFLASLCFQDPDFASYYPKDPGLSQKVVHYYNDANDYNCNVFVPRAYLETHWFPMFGQSAILPLAHDHQTAVVLKVK